MKQHYVPQFYLKNFCYQDELIHCLDKTTKKQISTHIDNVACEKWFYGKKTTLESNLSLLEAKLKKAADSLIKYKTIPPLRSEERSLLSVFIAFQYTRTPGAAQKTQQNLSPFLRFVEKQIGISDYKIELPKPTAIGMTIQMFPKLAPYINGMAWSLLENNTGSTIYTSDNPVVLHNPFTGELGFGCAGLSINLPLSNELVLECFVPIEDNLKIRTLLVEEQYSELSDENIQNLNILQVQNATRHIFSKTGNFDFAEKILKEMPISL